MNKLLSISALLLALLFGAQAQASGTRPVDMTASGPIVGTQVLWCQTPGTVVDRSCTFTLVAAFINSLFSGDATVNSTGTITLKNTGPGATGPIGSTTTTPVVTIDAQGRVTALSSATIASGSGTVTSVAAGCGTSTGGAPITTNGAVASAITDRVNTATSGTTANFASTDCGNIVYDNSASAVAGTIAQAGTTGFAAGTFFERCNINTGTSTITPTTSTIGGAATLVINGGTAANPNCVSFQSDGTNYNLMDTVKGAGVQAALGNALSTVGGLTSTIASGTAALGTSAIGAGACGTATTVSAPNVTTTDRIKPSFQGDPTATTGYTPAAMLTIVPFPTSGNVNFKQCNLTGSSITPSALTINWDVER